MPPSSSLWTTRLHLNGTEEYSPRSDPALAHQARRHQSGSGPRSFVPSTSSACLCCIAHAQRVGGLRHMPSCAAPRRTALIKLRRQLPGSEHASHPPRTHQPPSDYLADTTYRIASTA